MNIFLNKKQTMSSLQLRNDQIAPRKCEFTIRSPNDREWVQKGAVELLSFVDYFVSVHLWGALRLISLKIVCSEANYLNIVWK
jgi:hypothetical protein